MKGHLLEIWVKRDKRASGKTALSISSRVNANVKILRFTEIGSWYGTLIHAKNKVEKSNMMRIFYKTYILPHVHS